jgi:shikimate kinase
MEQSKRDLLYLTGFMGSGKSSVAPILANTLGYASVDIDAEIEKATGKRVTEIFSEQGEEFFRSVEQTLLRDASRRHACVVSLGGGTIANEENLKIIKSTGVLVYLRLDVEHIFRRLKFKKNRPLLIQSDGTRLTDEELLARISGLLVAREPFYIQSDVIITTNDLRIGITVDEIVRRTKMLIA